MENIGYVEVIRTSNTRWICGIAGAPGIATWSIDWRWPISEYSLWKLGTFVYPLMSSRRGSGRLHRGDTLSLLVHSLSLSLSHSRASASDPYTILVQWHWPTFAKYIARDRKSTFLSICVINMPHERNDFRLHLSCLRYSKPLYLIGTVHWQTYFGPKWIYSRFLIEVCV